MALEPCTDCGQPVWPENNPCDNCKTASNPEASESMEAREENRPRRSGKQRSARKTQKKS